MSDDFNIYLGNFIKDLRKNKKLSQEEFCNLLDNKISRSNLSKIELGKISTSADVIREILIIFKISPYSILNIENNIDYNDISNKYNLLNNKDRLTINSMIEVLLNNNSNLSVWKNTEEGKEENKKSS